MFEATHSDRAEADPAAIWALWTDPGRWPDWNEQIDHAEIVGALKQGVTAGRIYPVTCEVATRNLGTNRLLELELPGGPPLMARLTSAAEFVEDDVVAVEVDPGQVYVYPSPAPPQSPGL